MAPAKRARTAEAAPSDFDALLAQEAVATYRSTCPIDLLSLKTLLLSLPEQTLSSTTTSCPALSLINYHPRKPVRLHFRPPTGVFLAGPHAVNGGIGGIVDVGVEMPLECFGSKDYQDYVYHDKRILYLNVLGQALAAAHPDWAVTSEPSEGHDHTRPVLVCGPWRLVPCMPPALFPAHRWELGNVKDRRPGGLALGAVPTPRYNAGLLRDAGVAKAVAPLRQACALQSALPDALVLCGVWLQRRAVAGRPAPCAPSQTLVALDLPAKASCLQLFRAFLSHMASGAGYWAAQAKAALAELRRGGLGRLLGPLGPPVARFDVALALPVPPQPAQLGEDDAAALCDVGDWQELCRGKLEGLLERALGKRAAAVLVSERASRAAHAGPGGVRLAAAARAARAGRRGRAARGQGPAARGRGEGGRVPGAVRVSGRAAAAAVWTDVQPPSRIPAAVCAHIARTHLADSGPVVELGLAARAPAPNARVEALAEIEARLRVDGVLPLKITSVLPASPLLRALGGPDEAVADVVLVLERTAAWPRSEVAARQARVAMGLRLARALQGEHCLVNADGSVDVRGLRLQLGEADARTELHATLAALGPAWRQACSVCLLWARAHCVQLSAEAVELLCASLFVDAFPHDPPRSVTAALARFLVRLKDLDDDGVVFAGPDAQQRSRACAALTTHRHPPLVVLTPDDEKRAWRSSWAENTSALGLDRARRVAADSLRLLEALAEAGSSDQSLWQAVLCSDRTDFDARLLLKPERDRALGTFKNLEQTRLDARVGIDVEALLLRDIKQRFGFCADFFWGPGCIGVIWKKNDAVPFRVAVARAAIPVEGGRQDLVEINKLEVLDECARLGKGVVERVNLLK